MRNIRWARTQGVGQLVEEHELHPVTRAVTAVRKARWRRRHGVLAGRGGPVFLFGAPRSGNEHDGPGPRRLAEFEVYNDGDAPAFLRHRLRSDEVVRTLVVRSRHRFVLFKPILDADRVVELLDELGTPRPPRALWAYRDVDGRTRSALTKFGPAALRAMQAIAAGGGSHLWQSGGLSEESLDLIRGVDWDRADPADGAAMLWLVLNRQLFERGLDAREDVLPVSYDALVRAPEATVRVICRFLGVPWDPGLAAHIDRRSLRPREPLRLDPAIRERCEVLAARLDAASAAAASRWTSPGTR